MRKYLPISGLVAVLAGLALMAAYAMVRVVAPGTGGMMLGGLVVGAVLFAAGILILVLTRRGA